MAVHIRIRRPAGRALSVAGVLAALAAAPALAEARNTWRVAGANVQAPGYQTATVLRDGRVLAVGGQGAKAELFDPQSDRWTAAASMNHPRKWATATLLPDGKVLVAGGADETTFLAAAEVYDPATDRWTPTPEHGHRAAGSYSDAAVQREGACGRGPGGRGLLHHAHRQGRALRPGRRPVQRDRLDDHPRYFFTATPLADGTVLVADSGPADIYDPATGQFTPTAPLPRDDHSVAAVRLRDGRVLSIGGSHGLTTAAVIYVPATRTWQPAASLNWGRFYAPFAAVGLADGRVLVVGGSDSLKVAETWDPATGTWTNTGQLANARLNGFGLVRLGDDRVLVDGGAVRDEWCDNEGGGCFFGPLHPAEIYTP